MFVSRLLCFLALAIVSSGSTAAQEESRSPAQGLAVYGSATYDVAPTIVRMFTYLQTSGALIEDARDPHPAALAKVRKVLDEQAANGLEIVRSTYRISQSFPYRYDDSPNVTPEMKEQSVFDATTTFELVTRNFATIDAVATAIAATDLLITSTEFQIEDDRAALLEARKAAARDALSQAEAYADALQLKLVGVRSVTDGEARPPDGYADLGVMPPDGSIRIVIPETIPFTASVYVTWDVELAAAK